MNDLPWTLRAALGLGDRPELISLVGGGGKTSLLFALADELPGRVVVTTTTRIFAAQIRQAPAVCYADNLSQLGELLARHRVVLVVGRVAGEKALGVDRDLPARLLARPDVDQVVVEADGSRMRPVKAPAEHEPVIPRETTLLIPVAGLDALEGALEEVAHRPQLVEALLKQHSTVEAPLWSRQPLLEGGRLTPAGLSCLLTHPLGGHKGAPDHARFVPILNKVENELRSARARQAAKLILRDSRVSRVILAAVRSAAPVREVWRRVTAVVLAAGESARMGRQKLLLPWRDSTVLGQTLANVQDSAVGDVWVVSGHGRQAVETLAAASGARVIHNSGYANGMLSSLQTAVRAVSPGVEAVLVVLGDQPMVSSQVIDRLLIAYAGSTRGLITPYFQGQRGNPVLVDRRHFAELLALPVGGAPRTLLQRHPDDLLPVEVDDEAILHDLDRPEDYERWLPN